MCRKAVNQSINPAQACTVGVWKYINPPKAERCKVATPPFFFNNFGTQGRINHCAMAWAPRGLLLNFQHNVEITEKA